MSRVVDLEEASRLTGLTKIELGRRFQERDLKGHNDPTTRKLVFYLEDLRGVNGYQPPEPSPPPKPQPPPPPKPEPWIPSHAEIAAIIKLDDEGRDVAMATSYAGIPTCGTGSVTTRFRRFFASSGSQPHHKPNRHRPLLPSTSAVVANVLAGAGNVAAVSSASQPPEPPLVKPAPPEPPKPRQPPPFRPAPPQPSRTEPPRPPPEPLPDLWPVLRSVLVELATRPLRRLRYRIESHEIGREFIRVWDNKAGRTIIIFVSLYVVWRVL